MTFAQFRGTRQQVDDLAGTLNNGVDFYDRDGNVVAKPGFIYDGDLYVELEPDGQLYLILCNDEYLVPNDRLEELELRLYEWALTENSWDDVDEAEKRIIVTAVSFANELRACTHAANFAAIRELNRAETVPGVCHSHDFCDANEVMMRACVMSANYCGVEIADGESEDLDELMIAAWAAAAPLIR